MRTETPLLPQIDPFSPSPRRRRKKLVPGARRRSRFSPWMLLSVVISAALIVAAAAYFVVMPLMGSHAANAQANGDCTLIVPPHPLSADGLATPYQLVATDPNKGPCNETNADQSAFVQAAIFDFNTAQFSIYNPLVIDQGSKPAVNPVKPTIPKDAAVALWFGFNGANLTLKGNQNSLQDGHCVNGGKDSIFGQFAYCNAPFLFGLVNQDISIGRLVPPPLGTAKDGLPCPTLHDFSVIDQDQSDNVTGTYLANDNGQLAQFSAANQQALPKAQVLSNASDNGLLDNFIDPALGCTPWKAPDLGNGGQMTTALPLNEVQAMVYQQNPIALVPMNDPMVLDGNGNPNLDKTNLYRFGVDQPRALNNGQADPKTYCQHMVDTGAPRIVKDAPMTAMMASPVMATGNNLFTFLGQRFSDSYTNLNCQKLTGKNSPITTKQDNNGVAIAVLFNGQVVNAGGGTPNGPPPGNGPDCKFNGQVVKGCSGTVNVNGQTCTVSFDAKNNVVNTDCKPAK